MLAQADSLSGRNELGLSRADCIAIAGRQFDALAARAHLAVAVRIGEVTQIGLPAAMCACEQGVYLARSMIEPQLL